METTGNLTIKQRTRVKLKCTLLSLFVTPPYVNMGTALVYHVVQGYRKSQSFFYKEGKPIYVVSVNANHIRLSKQNILHFDASKRYY